MKHLMENWRRFLTEEESDFETHMMYDPESGDKKEAKSEAEHNALAAKGYVHVDPAKVRKALEDEGGAAGTDAIVDRTDSSKEEVEKTMDNMPDVAQHKKGDYILGDKDKVKIQEDCWDGYERNYDVPEGEQGSCKKKTNEGAEGGFQVGEFVNVVDGSLKGATGKVVELTTTTTGEEGYVIELYSDAKMKVFGKRGDEVIAVAGDLESGGTTDGMELYDIDEGAGLWKNIHAKKKRMKAGSGEKKAKPGDEDYPETLDIDEAELTERGSPLESNFQNAIMDFIVEQMQSMGMNAGDPNDRDRIKSQVMSIVNTAISAIGLEEGNDNTASYLSTENLSSFVDMVLDEAADLEEGGQCTKATEKTTSTAKGKKYMKCIKNPDGEGYIRKHWGQKGARAAPKGSARNKSFRARHGCSDAKAGTAKKLACDDW